MSQRQINIIPLIHFLSSSELKCKTETLSVFFISNKDRRAANAADVKNNSPLKQRHQEETEELSNFTQRNKSDKSGECKTLLKTFFGGKKRLMAA